MMRTGENGSICLDNVGRIAQAQRRLDDAATLLKESLLLCHRPNLAFPAIEEYQVEVARLTRQIEALTQSPSDS